ncbi:PT domain-containing protein [uncultured Megasphaera sp.]|uniref:PT domain-containing protein n=1 Tax=uncultured Megasphaera sp. TaxID=165188 RepID=UPI00338F9008
MVWMVSTGRFMMRAISSWDRPSWSIVATVCSVSRFRSSNRPSSRPSFRPSARPSSRPSAKPSARPSSRPFCQPSVRLFSILCIIEI